MTEVVGGLMPAVRIAGLQQPLSLTLRQYQDVLQLKVRLADWLGCHSLGGTRLTRQLVTVTVAFNARESQ